MRSPHAEHDTGRWRGALWFRVAALLCVFLLAGASTAQVCHSHDDGSVLSKSAPSSVPTDHCPLCLAMHTALAAADQTAPLLMQGVQELAGETREVRPALAWSFSLFSRPPPAIASPAKPMATG